MEVPVTGVGHSYNHVRQESDGSVTDIISQPQQQPHDVLADPRYQQEPTFPATSKFGEGLVHSTPTHIQHNDLYYGGSTSRRDNPYM